MSHSPAETLNELKRQYYRAWFRFHPEAALDVGVTDHIEQLRVYDDDDIGALATLNQMLITALEEINVNELNPESLVDYRILKGAAEIELHDLEERDWRFRNPADFIPVNAIYQLLIYPVDGVHRAVKKRLEQFPEYLRGARTLMLRAAEHVVPSWLDVAIEQSRTGSVFIRDLGRYSLLTQKFTNPARLQPLLDDAAHALEDYARFLESEVAPHAKGEFFCGEHRFNRLLNDRHFLNTTAKSVLEFGERILKQTREDLLKQTRLMQGDDDVAALLKKIQVEHPEQEKLFDDYRKSMLDSYRWWSKSGLVSIPETQSLKVQETPAFLRSMIPFAAYQPPCPGDKLQQGLYYVTPVNDDAQLQEHNRYSIDLTCAHEAYPGHHLQFVTEQQRHADNTTRLVNASASMYEGWALYCEELAIEQGLLNKDEHRFIMLRDRLWRALRVIIDVKLQTGQLGIEEATVLLMSELGFGRAQAEAEINWYSGSPAVPLCYATGRELIKAVRDEVMSSGHKSLMDFHDGLLAQGSIALPLGVQLAFGDEVWHKAHTRIFGAGGVEPR